MKNSLLIQEYIPISAQQYLTDASNQLLSPLNQSELVDEGYKVVLYLENDFVHALGFLTPFNGYVQKEDINEIVIDSTFKTNQEKFELFVVLINPKQSLTMT
mgnify:CR=1 FL=1